VCHPIRFSIPAARAAGRKYLRKITLTYELHSASPAKAFVLVHPVASENFDPLQNQQDTVRPCNITSMIPVGGVFFRTTVVIRPDSGPKRVTGNPEVEARLKP